MTKLYLQLNQLGSGETTVNRNDDAADDLEIGKFIRIVYRGAERGGFFIDNLKNRDAARGGEQAREIRASGPGVLSILEDARVWFVSQGESNRRFTAQNIGFILDTVLTEAQARGCFPNLIWDFDTAVDSDGEAWAETHTLDLKVGDSLLDVVKNFSELGVDFKTTFNPAADQYVLSAFESGIGSDKTNNVVFRIGLNAKRASHSEEGNLIKNAYLVEAQGAAYSTITDPTSISAFRRREALYGAGQAPDSTQADVFANAELTLTKDPKPSYSIVVSDAQGPIAFQDYEIGDTVGYDDGDGVVVSLRVVGMMLDFDAGRFADITVELSRFVKGTEIETAQKMRRLAPGMGASGNSTGTTTQDHGTLAGLADDDHTQYLLVDGTRALGGPWDMGNFSLTNVNIDSGEITGITDLAIADGGTGASTAADARTNLGLVAGGAGDIWVEKAGDIMVGDLILNDSVNLLLGTASNASLSYDGSDLFLDPNVVGSGDFIIQPTTDSATLLQILDAAGGTSVLTVDTTNERVGVGGTPDAPFTVRSTTGSLQTFHRGASNVGSINASNLDLNLIAIAGGSATGVLVLGAAGSESMRINASRNIGIGTGVTVSAFVHIKGIRDDEQFKIQAFSTQTANVFEQQKSDTTVALFTTNDGDLIVGEATKQANSANLQIGGAWTFKETTAPPADAGYGKMWTESNNELFFQSGDGNTHLLHGDAFSNIWFHSSTADTVTIASQDTFTKIGSFENVGDQDDLGNVIGDAGNDELTIAAIAGGDYNLSWHTSITSTGASREMVMCVGIELNTPLDITNVTDDTVTPIVITSTAHGLLNGDMVEILGVLGNTAANGSFIVANKAADTFELVKLDGAATTGNGDYNEGSPTGDVTIIYPGNLVIHREVSQIDLGVGGGDADKVLQGGDKVGVYVANLDAASDLNVFQISLRIGREGD